MKLKNFLIVSIIIFAITIFLTSFWKHTENFTGIFGGGEPDTTTCSVSECGLTGTQYKAFMCTDSNNVPVDPLLCGPDTAILLTNCTASTGTCYEPQTYTWVYKNPVPCYNNGFQYYEINKSICVDDAGVETSQTDQCPVNVLPDTTNVIATPDQSRICTVVNGIGLQNCHYQFNEIIGSSTLLGGCYKRTLNRNYKQTVRYLSSTNHYLTLPLSGLNGFVSGKLNTIIFPKGLLGNFLIILLYPFSASNLAINMTATTSTPDSLDILQNYFRTGKRGSLEILQFSKAGGTTDNGAMHNTDNSSSKLFYYILPIRIKDAFTSSEITFSCDSAILSLPSSLYADLFVLQADSYISTCDILTIPPGFKGENCNPGGLPLMARYQFTQATVSEPLGTLEIKSDNIGITFSQVNSVATINIPIIYKYAQTADDVEDIGYLLIINWHGTTVSTNGVGLTFSAGVGISQLSLFSSGITPVPTITNSGDTSTELFYCTAFKLSKMTKTSFTISVDNTSFPQGVVSGDLIIIQYTGNK